MIAFFWQANMSNNKLFHDICVLKRRKTMVDSYIFEKQEVQNLTSNKRIRVISYGC
jgi:hypothetical protein